MRLGCVDRRERQAGEHLVEEPLEFVAAHAVGELEPLDAGLGETPGPVPRLELPDRLRDEGPGAPADPGATRSRAPPARPGDRETWAPASPVRTGCGPPRRAVATPRAPPAPGRGPRRGLQGSGPRAATRDPRRVPPRRGPRRRGSSGAPPPDPAPAAAYGDRDPGDRPRAPRPARQEA